MFYFTLHCSVRGHCDFGAQMSATEFSIKNENFNYHHRFYMTVIVTQWEGRAGRCDLGGEPFDHLQFITIAGFCM